MAITDDFRSIVARLRSWNFNVVEWSGCYGRGNGTSWTYGKPVWHTNHHYVCSLNPSQDYINSLVSQLAGGSTVNWFADVNGKGYLIGTGPMNHAGTGNSSVLNKLMQDIACPGVAGSAGDMSGNQTGSGTECQHPGDGTPWPNPMLDIMVAINAAEFVEWGYTANRAANHYAWTNRKIDMSWMGGPSSGNAAGNELISRVKARMSGSNPPDPDGGNPLADISQKDADLIGASVAKALMTYAASYAVKSSGGDESQKKTNVLGVLQDMDTHLSRTSYNTDQINRKS